MTEPSLQSPTPEELLAHPKAFERKDFSSYLFRPYSIKERRSVSLYTPPMYVLWLRLESDPDVVRFNTEVKPFPVAVSRSSAINAAPRCVSLDSKKQLTIHSFEKIIAPEEQVKPDEVNALVWSEWASARNFVHKSWSVGELFGNEIYNANLGRLLGYVSRPGFVPNTALEDSLLIELRGFRKTTFAKLSHHFSGQDPEVVNETIASLILSRRVFSDILSHPFSMVTMLSAFREVDEA